ncbi:hypothetical protein NST99_26305 [Paenibacillus sp. FSL L8-0470]|uniref:hypothetical protein n=1 Tax=Paenibacillus sp. FSL L8-0470 TaxID=2954688 RepID=UPI0030F544C1
MKSQHSDKEGNVMFGAQDWYAKAGRIPFQDDGFTPELMARIQQAADNQSAGKRIFRSGKSLGLAGLAAILLLGVLVWPFSESGAGRYIDQVSSLFSSSTTAELPPSAVASASPSAASQGFNPPIGSAEFEIGGQKYYMPLPMDRNKALAYAAETSQGIIWSPPPPMVNYTKPKYTHNTEPYTLYLTPKGHAELSAATAQRIYTFPLYAGGAQSYYELAGIYGAGDYILMVNRTYTVGEPGLQSEAKLSVINVKEAADGRAAEPWELLTLKNEFAESKSFIAVNPQEEEVLLLYYVEDGKGGYTAHNKLYDIKTGNVQILEGTISTDEQVTDAKTNISFMDSNINTLKERLILTAHYEVQGEKRSTEITLPIGEQWLFDWEQEYGINVDPWR